MPADRVRYLSEITETVRGYHARTTELAEAARNLQRVQYVADQLADGDAGGVAALLEQARKAVPHEVTDQVERWPAVVESYSGDEQVVVVRDREITTRLTKESLSGNKIPRVALPRFTDHGELVRFWRNENLPGYFPFTAGVFPFKRDNEDPARMFAGEGDPARTNRRFKILSEGNDATRLSTAFDSVTLYGRDPDPRPDVYGKVGTSGVSVATLDDMKELFDGFDLVAPTTSVSLTINGPAPTVLAFFLNTAIDQQVDAFREREGREPSAEERASVAAYALANVRGTVQADILKEDQGQNTALFSTEFCLRMMADIQEWFIEQQVRNFYSVSISGYHIAEAGANPISQLAFTLANGFTYVEAYLARGMKIDDFAPNLSFFFSNGMDPEYSVLGRVARRIWAVTMKEKYGASRALAEAEVPRPDERSVAARAGDGLQRHPHHAAGAHRDLRQRQQPPHQRVRRGGDDPDRGVRTPRAGDPADHQPRVGPGDEREPAPGLLRHRRPHRPRRGGGAAPSSTAINERGGVLGAMETGYQRGRIQDESMLYEHRKHDGSLPIIGVNTFVKESAADAQPKEVELARATESEKESQLARVRGFQAEHGAEAQEALARLKDAAISGDNVFAVLMDAARVCSLQQVTEAFFEVGGQYRRNV